MPIARDTTIYRLILMPPPQYSIIIYHIYVGGSCMARLYKAYKPTARAPVLLSVMPRVLSAFT